METTQESKQKLVLSFINETGRDIFITGKAGTGKTTLLQEIRKNTKKKTVVAGPTGVAAINAGGVTLHSYFKLPNELILPLESTTGNYKTIGGILSEISFTQEKEKQLLELELLVIDEVSMLRADILDAIDRILKQIRRNPDSFGGVQVVYFGDLYQLPPVADNAEEIELKKYYNSIFFFDAHIFKSNPPILIELKQIFRQSDPIFLKLLNNIRNNQPDNDDLEILSQRYFPDFQPLVDDHYVRLTSHRKLAEQINQQQLEQLPGELFVYQASLSGIIESKNHPVEQELKLKINALVMFIRNDVSGTARYYNGKMGIIKELSSNHITVIFPGGQEIIVEPERWQMPKNSGLIMADNDEENTGGEIRQYPLRLAWAMTIHKSQGLTFDKAIIDAGASFAPGQVYVALSRVRTLAGIVLFTPINRENLFSNSEVVAFNKRVTEAGDAELELDKERRNYIYKHIRSTFRFVKLLSIAQKLPSSVDKYRFSSHSVYLNLAETLSGELVKLDKVSTKLISELDGYWNKTPAEYAKGKDLLTRAKNYYSVEILSKFIKPIKTGLAEMLVKRAPKEIAKFYALLESIAHSQIKGMEDSLGLWESLSKDAPAADLLRQIIPEKMETGIAANAPKPKLSIGLTATQKSTLKLFNEGKTLTEIAEKRNIGLQTVEAHIIEFIEAGNIAIEDFLLKEKIDLIQQLVDLSDIKIHLIKQQLGTEITYFEIRLVVANLKFNSNNNSGNWKETLF